jgi:hydroxypyruvate isomerase
MNRRDAFIIGAGIAGLTACAGPSQQAGLTLKAGEKTDLLSGYALNVESWYADLDFAARFDKAARDGFSHVEFWFIDSWDRKASELAKLATDAGVRVAQIVGDSPPLALSGTRDVFLENCKRAVENARILDTDIVTLTGHQNVDGVSKADSLKSYRDHMAAAAPIFEDARVFAAIEPFNPYDHPGHFIYGSADAVEIVQAINSPYMKLNWDLFHMQRHEGELIGNLKRHADTICYVQLADTPDRAQPGTGDVNYANVLKQVRAGGYDRPIGLELWAKDKDYDQAVADILKLSQAMKSES